jgi:hypothetical protein
MALYLVKHSNNFIFTVDFESYNVYAVKLWLTKNQKVPVILS